jgi:predicted protein tyrosine phosphatase
MSIIVCPLSRAPQIARDKKPSRVVSLLDPASSFPVLVGYGHDRHLCVEVHDINEEAAGMDACSDERMRRIIAFVSEWDRRDPMLIHCYAGISRSTATAYIAACVHNPDTDELQIAQTLRSASAAAWPNRRFVALADAELGRDGRMSQAIADIGDGHNWYDIGENEPFVLPSSYEAAR